MTDIFAGKIKGRQRQRQLTKLNQAASRLDQVAAGKPQRDPLAQEISRIIGLPLVLPVTDEEVEAFNRENLLVDAWNSTFRLWPAQVGSVLSYDLYDGGFFPISVGAGKTLISLMIAERAYRGNINRSLLLVPPQVYSQLINRSLAFARSKVPISVPFIKMGNISLMKRKQLAMSGRAGCYLLPYSCLSTVDSSELIEAIQPELIIADEAHLLKNIKAARTKRIRRYLDKHDPQMVAMSGTITSKSITDYWHLIRACLKRYSPLPGSTHILRQWSQVLDAQQSNWGTIADYAGYDGFQTEPVMPLVRWAQKHFPAEDFPETIRGFRRAYQHRLQTSPGVVVSADHEIGTSLVITNEPAKEVSQGWAELTELIRQVQKDFEAPNGDQIDHAIHQFSWLYQLSAGFYYDLYWPEPQVLAREREIPESEAQDLLDRAREHHAMLQLYHSALRKWLDRRSKPGLDTPFLVAADMAAHGDLNLGDSGDELFQAWSAVRALDFPGRPERRSRPVRVCPYKILQAAEWACQEVPAGYGAVLWVHHQEIGRWLVEVLQDSGREVLHCPAGRAHDIAIADLVNRSKLVVASISAHGTGKDLQHFQHQFVVQWPRSAVVAEQMMGRLHRPGQEADELVVYTNNTTDIDELNFAACLNDAAYIHDSTGVRQKLMYASYTEAPTVIDPSILRKRGLDPKRLTGEQIQLLQETFGNLSRSIG